METLIFKKNKFIATYLIIMDSIGRIIRYFIAFFVPVFICIMAYYDGGRNTPLEKMLPAFITAISIYWLIIIIKCIRECLFYKNQSYAITEHKIITQGGIFSKWQMNVSIRNIVTIYCQQSILERFTKTATIYISTNAIDDEYLVLEHINDFENIKKTIDDLRLQNY